MEGPEQFEEPVSRESAEQNHPLPDAEAEMFLRAGPDGGGIFAKISELKFARMVFLATALSGAFAIGFRPSVAEAGDDRGGKQEYTIDRQDIYDKAGQEEQARLRKGYAQKDKQIIEEVARNRARADFLRQQNPMDIIGAARERERARIEAQDAKWLHNRLQQIGRDAAKHDAMLKGHPVDQFIEGTFNSLDRIISPKIDRLLDGR